MRILKLINFLQSMRWRANLVHLHRDAGCSWRVSLFPGVILRIPEELKVCSFNLELYEA